MSNTTAYNVLEAIAEALKGWAQESAAKIVVAENPAHAIDTMGGVKPGKATVVIFYVSDSPAGGELGVLDTALQASVRLGVIQHPGLALKGGKPAAVLQTVDSLRRYIANVIFDGLLDGRLAYSGMSYIATEAGRLLNGYALTYSPLYAFEV